ncbi:hypothetical protein DQP55_09455 [Mycolicibacterium sp. GF69]|uniref:hypothetical protein n=1 Tax=Mycolicibacterium sp. GF69 TaxID=2267251 RepID=UPI000DCC02CF|nr:hypothetical protein [Mycolicibacterium sp. GF69]RAV13951.1 hypothetical protein DQP55_09455 [Mycolicibacterium sp. GF69]
MTGSQKPVAARIGATSTAQPTDVIDDRSVAHTAAAGAAPDIISVPGDATAVETVTVALDPDISLPQNYDTVGDSTVVTQSSDPALSTTQTSVVSGLLSVVGLGLPLSAADGPVAPPSAVILVGSLDLVRRDLERITNVELAADTQQVTTNALIDETQSDEWLPVASTAASESAPEPPSYAVPDPLTVEPTATERTAAFQKEQAKRVATFTEEQTARTAAFKEQLAAQSAENPLGALVNSVGFVVSEVANTAAFVVTEFVNYISFAVTEFIQGLKDWFTAPAVFSGLYGDPEANAQYWRVQSAENCVLQSAAMIVGQLTGTTPEEADIAQKAMEADSVANPGEKMYEGLNTQDRVDVRDAIALLDNEYGITATLTKYDKSEGNLALRALAFALEDNTKAVSVGLQGGTIWSAVEGNPLPGISSADHQVVVTGIDFDERVVYLNDSGFPERGRNLNVPLDAFMRAWQTDNYETVIAQLKQPNTSASGPESPHISNSGILLDVA